MRTICTLTAAALLSLTSLGFADDTAKLAEAKQEIQELRDMLVAEQAESRAREELHARELQLTRDRLENEQSRYRAMIDELRKHENQLADEMITQARNFDLKLRDAHDALEAEQRDRAGIMRDAKLTEARLRAQVEELKQLLRKNGIELPKPTVRERLAETRVSLEVSEGATLGHVVKQLSELGGVNLVLDAKLADLKVLPIKISRVSIDSVLGLILDSAGGDGSVPLSWRIDQDVVRIERTR